MPRLILCSLLVAGLAFAASPLATITSSAPFRVAGTRVPSDGVPNWPLVGGDEVQIGKAPALVKFRDGSQIQLQPNSRFVLQAQANGARLQMISGSARVALSPASHVEGAPNLRNGVVLAGSSASSFVPTRAAAATSDIELGMRMASTGGNAPLQPRAISAGPVNPNTAAPGQQETAIGLTGTQYSDLVASAGTPQEGQTQSNTLELVELPQEQGETVRYTVPLPIGEGGATVAAQFQIVHNGFDGEGNAIYQTQVLLDSGAWADVPGTTTPGNSVSIIIGF